MLFGKKRGSISLSVNSIVVIILAVTLLGLGLVFVNSVFNEGTEPLSDISNRQNEENRKQFLNDCNDNVCVDFSKIKLERNNKKQLYVVMNNKDDCSLKVDIEKSLCRSVDSDANDDCDRDILVEFITPEIIENRKKLGVFFRVTPQNTAIKTNYVNYIKFTGTCEDDPNNDQSGFTETIRIQTEVE